MRAYRHLLACTDGSRVAARGIRRALGLAKRLGAKLTVVYVIPPSPAAYGETAGYYFGGFTPADYKRLTEQAARKALDTIAREARARGVRCSTRFLTDARAWRGILRAARGARCDLVVMASHGRGGLGRLLLGSQTAAVLAHARLPVLVVR